MKRSRRQRLPVWAFALSCIVLIGLFIGLLLLFKPQGMDRTALFGLYVVIALFASFALFGVMHSHALKKTDIKEGDGKGKRKRIVKEWSGPVVLFLVLMGMALQWQQMPDEEFSYAVFLRDVKGQTLLKGKGTVSIILGGVPRRKQIDDSGRALFEGIPASYRDKTVPLELEDTDWQLENGNATSCRLKDDSVILTIQRKQGLGSVAGRVVDEKNNVVSGAMVSILDITVNTDENGWFELHIPQGKQAEEQILMIQKKGFKTKRMTVYPGQDQNGLNGIPLFKE